MKIKVRIFIIIAGIAIMNATMSQAQPYYQTTTIYDLGNGVSYKCDIQYGALVTLYNSKNIYTYKEQTYADGSEYPTLAEWDHFTMTKESDTSIQSRVNSALTSAQKQIIGDNTLGITVIISPQTEKIIEVFFTFANGNVSKYNQLPPNVFRQIELNFLNNPTIPGFALTDVGRNLNYVMFTWSHEFK